MSVSKLFHNDVADGINEFVKIWVRRATVVILSLFLKT
jgi:hypothetical protein